MRAIDKSAHHIARDLLTLKLYSRSVHLHRVTILHPFLGIAVPA